MQAKGMGRALARRRLGSFLRNIPVEALESRRLLTTIVSNQLVNESIGALGETDTYEFDANAGDAVSLVIGATGGASFVPLLRVLNPSGVALTGFDISTDLLNLAQTGTYSVEVVDSGFNHTGTYAMTMIRVPGAQVPESDSGPITSNQLKHGELTRGDIDVFTFDANAGDSFSVVIGATGGASFVPLIRVFRPDGSAASGFDISFDAVGVAQSGTYYVMVRDSGDNHTGTYAMSMVRVPAAQAPENDSGPIASNEYRLGELTTGDQDVYTFDANAGDAFSVVVGFIGGTSFLPLMRVFRPDGSPASGFDISFDAVNITQSGTYTVLIRDSGDNHNGEYAISVVKFPGAHTIDADSGELASNRRRTGELPRGDIDVFTFEAQPGDAFSAVIGATGGTSFVPLMRVFRPDGSPLTGYDTAHDQLNLVQGGIYHIMVRDSGDNHAGTYSIALGHFPAAQPSDALDGDGGALVSGQVVSGAIDAGDLDVYTTTLTAGSAVTVRMGALSGASFAPRIDLFGPNGTRLGVAVGGAPTTLTIASVPATGTYYIVARENGDNHIGTYSLALDAQPAADTRAPTVTQSQFLFNVPRQQIRLRMNESVAGSVNVSDLTLLNLTTSQTIASANISATFNPPSNEIVFEFPGLTFRALPDGDYRATLNAGSVVDQAGNALAADASFEFYFLNGDANRDRAVTLQDFNRLAGNFGRTPRSFTQGDFNYDGSVTLQDFNILAARFGMSLAPATSSAAAPSRSAFGDSRIDDDLDELVA